MKRDNLKVIHSFPIWLPQTQTWMYNQVKYLPENIHTHIVCERTEHLDQFQLPNIHSLQKNSRILQYWEWGLRMLGMRHLLMHLLSTAKKTNAQLIHSHFGHIGWRDLVAAQNLGIKHVVTFYGADVNKLPTQNKNWLRRYQELFEASNLLLCEGPHMAKELIRMGCKPEKVRIHHLGIEIEKLRFAPRHWDGRGPLRVLIASSFTEKKGIPYALLALARLQRNQSFEITIIGGMPVVSTSHCDIPEVLQYGIEDWLVSERNVDGLVKKLQWLIDHPDWESFLIKGRQHVASEYDAVQQGYKLANIYQEIIQNRYGC